MRICETLAVRVWSPAPISSTVGLHFRRGVGGSPKENDEMDGSGDMFQLAAGTIAGRHGIVSNTQKWWTMASILHGVAVHRSGLKMTPRAPNVHDTQDWWTMGSILPSSCSTTGKAR